MLILAVSLLLAAAPPLVATVAVTPAQFVHRKDKVALVVTLTNTTEQPIAVLTGHAGNDNYFFALHLQDPSGKVVWDGDASRLVTTSDLPMGTFVTLAPHGQYQATLDWRHLYNLQPGTYQLRVIYRVEPSKEPHAAGYYKSELRDHHAFIGRVVSAAVTVESKAH